MIFTANMSNTAAFLKESFNTMNKELQKYNKKPDFPNIEKPDSVRRLSSKSHSKVPLMIINDIYFSLKQKYLNTFWQVYFLAELEHFQICQLSDFSIPSDIFLHKETPFSFSSKVWHNPVNQNQKGSLGLLAKILSALQKLILSELISVHTKLDMQKIRKFTQQGITLKVLVLKKMSLHLQWTISKTLSPVSTTIPKKFPVSSSWLNFYLWCHSGSLTARKNGPMENLSYGSARK